MASKRSYVGKRCKQEDYFPAVLKDFPSQTQIIWLFVRDHPGEIVDGKILSERRGGNARHYTRGIKVLSDLGLIIEVDRGKTIWKRPRKVYRVCNQG